ncbi:SIMPL domain-containing protein [Leisingera daeponensis]|uniref:SIMPL domain-containing protein n=1 Tax=Leisingera daeponensis TaxID=405746 RepID=UPI001C96B461|nr:SIMPL domain-containing protein [Leisingera daeponensis]MBY6057813.1 SIMPL domain-containing protein [Leisingera daeponensis]
MKAKKLLAAALMLSMSAGTQAASEAAHPRQITVTGEGTLQVAPELATITLGVTEEAEEAAAAMAAVSEDMQAVIARLKDAGIAAADMQTQQISMHPVWSQDRSHDNGGRREITGFEASNTLMVRVRDLSELGPVLDTVLRAGANNFQGLSFGVTDPSAVADRIRGEAVKDAMRKAQQLAEAAGMELGPVRSISEHGGGGGRPMMAMEMVRSDAMPIEAGELTFTHNVSVVFDMAVPGGE